MNEYTPSPSPQGKPCRRAIRYLYVLFAVTALCIIAGTACSVLAFDGQTRYFTSEYAGIAVFALLAICSVIAVTAFFVFDNNEADTDGIRHSKARYLILPELFLALACFRLALKDVGGKIVAAAQSDAKNSSLTVIALALLLMAFVLGFMYSCRFAYKNPSGTFIAVMGICRIIFFIYIITTLYFDMQVELNSPYKLIVQFTAATAAIQTCADTRGVISGITRRTYVAAKALSMTFGAFCFALIFEATVKGIALPDNSYLLYSAFFLSISIFNAYEITRIARSPEIQPQEFVERNDEI